MTENRKLASRFYERFVRLYPRSFRARFGESMIQTFADLDRERRRETIGDSLRFYRWTFGDVAAELVKQHGISLTEAKLMKRFFASLKLPAIAGLCVILPFVLLQWIVIVVKGLVFDSRDLLDSTLLFVLLWLGIVAIFWIVGPMFRRSKEMPREDDDHGLLSRPKPSLLVSIALALPFAFVISTLLLNIEPPFARALANEDPDRPNVLGTTLVFITIACVIAAGATARMPIIKTRRGGGSLLAHPANLVLTTIVVALLAALVGSLIVDQFPCWIGTPNCD